jgi:hypothetical protein
MEGFEHGMIQVGHGMARHGMAQHSTAGHSTAQHGMAQHGMIAKTIHAHAPSSRAKT